MPSKSELEQLYVKEGKSMAIIGKIYHVGPEKIRKFLGFREKTARIQHLGILNLKTAKKMHFCKNAQKKRVSGRKLLITDPETGTCCDGY